MTTRFVALDLVVREEFCNLSCDYCLTGQGNYHRAAAKSGMPLPSLLEAIARQGKMMDIPVVKISGGEYLLLDNAVEGLHCLAEKFETVVVMTNGLPLTSGMLKRLNEIPNLVLQLSLDSTTFESNRYRINNPRLHALFLDRLQLLCRSAIPFEVYLIINRNSIQTIGKTLDDIKAYGGAPVFPFPVRGPDREGYLPEPSQLKALRDLAENAEGGSLLPHKSYLSMLLEFCERGHRVERCHIPHIAFTAFDDGIVSSCPNIWFDEVANILEDGGAGTARKLEQSPLRRGLLRFSASTGLCRSCFTPWDIINLYVDGRIPAEELTKSRLFKGPRTLRKLEAIRNSVRESRYV